MAIHELSIAFESGDAGEAHRFAVNLEQDLRELVRDVVIKRDSPRRGSQDFGSTLILIFGTPVAAILARGVVAFLARNTGATVTITKKGDIVARNLDSRDASRIVEAFTKSHSVNKS